MWLVILTLLLILPSLDSTNSNSKLSVRPPPQRNFILEKYLGDWYVQGLSNICSWRGSRKFTDFHSRYELKPDNTPILIHTWRHIDCTTAVHQYQPRDIPGVFTLVDNIGDVITGESIVVATDYVSFAIKWGCAKAGLYGDCDDPYVVIKTRMRFPKRKTWRVIKNILYDYFRYPASELIYYPQNNPCYANLPPPLPGKPVQPGPNFLGSKSIIKEHHVML